MAEPGTSRYVNADWSRFVSESDPEACFGVALVDIDRLGLRDALERFEAEAEPKMQPRTADKMLRRPSDKAARRPASK